VSNEVLLSFRDLLIKGWSAETLDTFDGAHYRAVLAMSQEIGNHFREAAWQQLPEADFVIICGTDLCHHQPLLMSLLRRSVLENNTRVAIVGPTDSRNALAGFNLPATNDDLPAVIDGIWEAAVQSANATLNPSGKAKRARRMTTKPSGKVHPRKGRGQDVSREIPAVMVRQFLAAKQPLVIAGEALLAGQTAHGLSSLAKLAQLKSQDSQGRLLILKSNGNSAGAWKLGIAAQKSVGGRERLQGGIVVLEGEAATGTAAWTDRADLDFLAVISPYVTPHLRAKAHVLIPRPSWLEEAGTYTAMDGHEAARVEKVLQAPAGIRDTWQTLLALAERAGFHPPAKTLEALTRKVEAELNPGPEVRHQQNSATEGREIHD
jgi:NADH dehydrogenase/NADH:ubiquinone oxidoreductase subunit G